MLKKFCIFFLFFLPLLSFVFLLLSSSFFFWQDSYLSASSCMYWTLLRIKPMHVTHKDWLPMQQYLLILCMALNPCKVWKEPRAWGWKEAMQVAYFVWAIEKLCIALSQCKLSGPMKLRWLTTMWCGEAGWCVGLLLVDDPWSKAQSGRVGLELSWLVPHGGKTWLTPHGRWPTMGELVDAQQLVGTLDWHMMQCKLGQCQV